jgi:hypothetical protein
MPELVSLTGNKVPSSMSGSSKNKQSGRSGIGQRLLNNNLISKDANLQTITLLPAK